MLSVVHHCFNFPVAQFNRLSRLRMLWSKIETDEAELWPQKMLGYDMK